jgi:hypothetical protein
MIRSLWRHGQGRSVTQCDLTVVRVRTGRSPSGNTWNRYADAGVLQEAERSQAQGSTPGRQRQPAASRPAVAAGSGAALRAALAQGADDWQKLWALLCGLALTAPWAPAGPVSETVRGVGQEFPDIKDPHETALAEADKAARLLASLGLEPGAGTP